ncbi:Uncharacterized protein TCM_017266 [Theobroma cacao]|uniref:Uncharacterized protein n=1 Tax=Theobroma cacao TaxID=3641 RepID=A0A061EDZ2_THECC|nr:Uncharacterized protein TCM_017266 [Theobroma cacao]
MKKCQSFLFLGMKIWFWSIWVGVGHWSWDLTHQPKESGVCKESLTGLWLPAYSLLMEPLLCLSVCLSICHD